MDGGGARIDHKNVAFSEEWSKHHQQAWTRSELYDKHYTKWKSDNEQYKAWIAGGGGGRYRGKAVKQELTVAQKKATLQAQTEALG